MYTSPLGHCSLNAKQYNAKNALAKAISDCIVLLKVVWPYGMAMAIVAIPSHGAIQACGISL